MYSRKSLKDHQEESLFLMSEITRNQSLAIRGQAVEVVLAGLTTREAAEALGVSQSAVSKWMKKSQQGQSLSNKPRFGRPKVLDRISRIVIASLEPKSANLQGNLQLDLQLLVIQPLKIQCIGI